MRDVSGVQNNGTTTGGITGKGFMPGQSGNPGGRPKGLAKAVRELVGEDGKALVELMYSIAMDPQRKDTHRMRAAEWLGDRGWGKAAVFQPVEEYDPLGLADLQASAEIVHREDPAACFQPGQARPDVGAAALLCNRFAKRRLCARHDPAPELERPVSRAFLSGRYRDRTSDLLLVRLDRAVTP
jgi:hypothetical protein